MSYICTFIFKGFIMLCIRWFSALVAVTDFKKIIFHLISHSKVKQLFFLYRQLSVLTL